MRVAVAGAGIAGLTAAIALAARGFSVDVYERAAALEEIGAGIQLSPNAMAVLDRLGLAAELEGTLVTPEAIEIGDAQHGEPLARVPLGEAARRRYGSPYCLIRRADLQGALLRAAGRCSAISLHLQAEVSDVHESADRISFRAGETDSAADVLIAADGVRSDLRRTHFGHPAPSATKLTAWRALLPAADAPLSFSHNVTGLWLAPGAHLVHYKLQGGRSINIVAIAAAGGAAPTPPRAAFGPALGALLDAVPRWTSWPLLENDPAWPWTRGRVALVGDAAHAFLPTAAQGGAQAIEDAWVLAAALAASPHAPAAALARFEQARKPRALRVAREARRNLAIYHLDGISARLRNATLKTLPARLFLARLDWLYCWRPM